jgi:hypothetical protein
MQLRFQDKNFPRYKILVPRALEGKIHFSFLQPPALDTQVPWKAAWCCTLEDCIAEQLSELWSPIAQGFNLRSVTWA